MDELAQLLGERKPRGLPTDWVYESLLGSSAPHPLIAHCHLGLGKLYQRTNKREPAYGHLTTAATKYREMNMRCLARAAGTARERTDMPGTRPP
jgi:hypothetical protein